MDAADEPPREPPPEEAPDPTREDEESPLSRQERREQRRRREEERMEKHGASLRRVYRDALGKRASGRPQTKIRYKRLPPGVPKRKKEPGA
jgi:hypothetical protein